MDPKFQSSFIPKASVVGDNKPKEKLGLWGVVSALVFTASILFLGGVYAYKKMTLSAVSSIQADITKEQQTMDTTAINNIISFDSKIKSIRNLINNHVAVSQYFKLLENNTISDVQFLSARYNMVGGDISIDMKGKASGYATIANQEAVLLKNKDIISPVFDGFGLDTEGGVNFNLKFKIKDSSVKFSNLVQSSTITTGTTSTIKAGVASSTDDVSIDSLDDLTMPDISNL